MLPWLKIRVREFGDQLGFCPATRMTGGMLPSADITQMSKSTACRVNAIHLPSGDQSGSVGLPAPVVRKYWTAPPLAEIFARQRRS